ncbi:L-alanine exporter AlaE [Pseudomonas poae]|uniref:L-alanine exporter AlaE n=1 Tax=Pseudomonas poae TaxID=200451 RepID=A0A2S9E8N3_9PSED|nr:L-alanine exporter AlaE [Pseudomonas poae]PRA27850.1 L-alanine exporter AlaE [Pseudomonas poae]PRC11223.1 L-alanine exporter AlaE [Pseudomonas poae]
MSSSTEGRRDRWRSFAADTLALIVFFTVTGILNERYIAGMGWDQVLHARMLGAGLMVLSGRPYGLWRDWIMGFASASPRSQLLWDSLALVSFQVPIYAGILAISGANAAEVLHGTMGVTVIMLTLGRPYGAFLNFVRARFGLPAGGDKPMSLNS